MSYPVASHGIRSVQPDLGKVKVKGIDTKKLEIAIQDLALEPSYRDRAEIETIGDENVNETIRSRPSNSKLVHETKIVTSPKA